MISAGAVSRLADRDTMYAGFKRIEPGSLREPQFSFARRHGKRLFLELPEKIFE